MTKNTRCDVNSSVSRRGNSTQCRKMTPSNLQGPGMGAGQAV
jgi:hypothetical protein